MENKTLYIYMLVDPRNDKPFYVGRSFKPNRRVRRHISGSIWTGITHIAAPYRQNKCCVISSLILEGMYPLLIVLDSCDVHSDMSDNLRAMNFWEHLWALLILDNRADPFGYYPIISDKSIKSYIANTKHVLECAGYVKSIKLPPRKQDHKCRRDRTEDEIRLQDKRMGEFVEWFGRFIND